MSKTVLTTTRLGEAGSDAISYANALAMNPYVIVKHLGTKICGKFIYVQGDCPEHKQLRTIAIKSGKLVQNIISPEEAN
jgi:hypothetical protein